MSAKLEQTGARLDKSIAIKQEDSISFLISVVLTKYDFIMKTSFFDKINYLYYRCV